MRIAIIADTHDRFPNHVSRAIAGADELEEAAEDESEDDDSELREPGRARITGERAHLLVDIEPASRVEPPSIPTGTNKG